MNPQTNESGLNLPPPIVEQAAIGAVPEAGQRPIETQPAYAETAPSAMPTASAVPFTIPLPPAPQQAAIPQNDVVLSATQISAMQAADDGDLIEKEWVAKAKQIVEHNREDPYEQSKQLTEVKVDYLQKRYNKTVKLTE